MMKNAQCKIESPIGPLYLAANAKGLTGVFFRRPPGDLVKSLAGGGDEIKILAQAARELAEYFAGERRTFEVPLDAKGTEFQQKVWNELSKIPYGKTFSYSDIAKRIKNDKAVRAVGTANGRNPLAIIVPCHRVIAADGTLGGYAGGLDTKTQLLKIEGKV